VEPKHLLAMQDSLFEEDEKYAEKDADGNLIAGDGLLGKELSFEEFLEAVVHLRPGRLASVLDIAEFRKAVRSTTSRLDRKVSSLTKMLSADAMDPNSIDPNSVLSTHTRHATIKADGDDATSEEKSKEPLGVLGSFGAPKKISQLTTEELLLELKSRLGRHQELKLHGSSVGFPVPLTSRSPASPFGRGRSPRQGPLTPPPCEPPGSVGDLEPVGETTTPPPPSKTPEVVTPNAPQSHPHAYVNPLAGRQRRQHIDLS